MHKYLVIVESPAKVKTISKFLGANYKVMASQGHVRDLPKSQMGVDVEHDYEPKYITIRGKGDILAALRKEAKKADKVYLATDPDREGEAISWHLAAALKLEDKDIYRITFNEITKNAVKFAHLGAGGDILHAGLGCAPLQEQLVCCIQKRPALFLLFAFHGIHALGRFLFSAMFCRVNIILAMLSSRRKPQIADRC